MPILGIDQVTFGVTDPERAAKYVADWGLKRVGRGNAWRCVDGSEVRIVAADAPTLPAPIEEGSTSREVVWGVSSQRDLDAIAKELGRDRKVTVDRAGVVRSIDDIGLAIGFRISQRKKVKLAAPPINTPGRAGRVNRTAPFYERATPHEFSHIVYGVEDHKVMERFYVQRLGFIVSDRYEGRSVFLRATPRGNHHHIFVLNTADRKTHFNHLSFKVRDAHEVIGGGQHMAAQGWETQVGPGRHFPSSAVFWYFRTPLGGAFEYAADEDVLTADWKPRTFKMAPELFNEWNFHPKASFAGAAMANSRATSS